MAHDMWREHMSTAVMLATTGSGNQNAGEPASAQPGIEPPTAPTTIMHRQHDPKAGREEETLESRRHPRLAAARGLVRGIGKHENVKDAGSCQQQQQADRPGSSRQGRH